MPVLPDETRAELEASLAREVGKLNVRTRRELLRLIGDPPRLDNLTEDVWREILLDFEQTLTPQLEKTFIESAVHMMTTPISIPVDFDLINDRAVTWARARASETSQGMISYRRQKVHGWTADYLENKIDRDTYVGRIGRMFGTAKAEQIAITEVTTAAAEGERPIVEALTDQGVMLQKIWVTVSDRYVCPICDGLNETRANGIGFDALFIHPVTGLSYSQPPAHGGCRCGVRYDYVNDKVQ